MTRIHIIEDDDLVREAIFITLRDAGYQVSDSSGGAAGLMAVKQELPDLILCDVMMPEISGFDVLRELRTDPATVDIPFIYLTGRTDRQGRRAGMNLGASDYMTKPFAQDELIAAIESRLGQRERERVKQEETLTRLRKNIIYALPHEMRTPLANILGYSKFMVTHGKSIELGEFEDMADSIYRAGERLNRLIENYLVYAQLEIIGGDADQVEELRNHVLGDAAEVIVQVAYERAQQYDRVGDLSLEVGTSDIRMSKENLTKVTEEIVDNAFKFSQPGTRVFIKAARKDSHYSAFIRDHGRGMSTEQISSIGAYMQFDRALHEQQGLGLGFYLSKRIVELHGGEFEIRSQPGKGTGIYFSVPD
ncbi:MAG: hybrid sensor histidine kinase/response regulator [Anaerolineae bacterium]|nr:hybrid sensor histidine kinase/response regulator [Anaerolineae bacterium]